MWVSYRNGGYGGDGDGHEFPTHIHKSACTHFPHMITYSNVFVLLPVFSLFLSALCCCVCDNSKLLTRNAKLAFVFCSCSLCLFLSLILFSVLCVGNYLHYVCGSIFCDYSNRRRERERADEKKIVRFNVANGALNLNHRFFFFQFFTSIKTSNKKSGTKQTNTCTRTTKKTTLDLMLFFYSMEIKRILFRVFFFSFFLLPLKM